MRLAEKRTARFLLAGACDSYVSCVRCVHCVACVALDGNPALPTSRDTSEIKDSPHSDTRPPWLQSADCGYPAGHAGRCYLTGVVMRC